MSQLGLGMVHDDPGTGRRRRTGRGAGAVLVALLALVVVAAAVALALRSASGGSVDDYTGDGTGTVSVVVAKGDTVRQIGRTLAAAGVVATEQAFVDAAANDPRSQSIVPGTYQMRSQMSGAAAVALMLDPASRQVVKIAVPEGWRVDRIVAQVVQTTGLSVDEVKGALSRAGTLGLPAYAEGDPEGFLFPATYEFQPGVGADEVVTAMLQRFDQAAQQAGLEAGARRLGLTPLQVVTVASILQIEGDTSDYPKVARVIYNRLAQGMPLQMDSTVNYALGTNNLKLSASDLKTDSPYNTYLNTGLPPGPISAPGDDALHAALHPAKGSWLYFVATDPANHVTEFATTYDQFLALKRKYQANAG
ncbi:MAG: endolytic transglycosylase MltG [Frankiales bacterium]|nr:endolytic transglycosylase MltG [Frankiales bacterium]